MTCSIWPIAITAIHTIAATTLVFIVARKQMRK